ncbi:MAG: hypothetical protein KGM47_02415 [Acidobacteriota bacterium]|nr:hypothetical protein [Acidobacteriota bacterium]
MYRRRAIALVIVSIWIGWTLFVWFAATRSFRTASEVWQKPQPEFAALLKPLGESASLTVLKHFAGQVNARLFRAYGLAQIVLGVILVLLLWNPRPRDVPSLVLAVIMLALVVILAVFIAPGIASLGSALDFKPSPDNTARFWTLHGAYSGLDGVKLLAGIVMAVRWVWMA